MDFSDSDTRRIVLLGKTDSGKSSLGNTLFGEKDVFKVGRLAKPGTRICKSEMKTVNGRSLQLIDTPGFFDTDPRSTELTPELLRCITECAPGPHAFLLVLKTERYTVLEQAVVALMLRYFSRDALKYTTVVFTHGNNLPEGTEIREWVDLNHDLRTLVQRCGGRCHVIDNKHWNNGQDPYRNNQYQIEQLLRTIDQTVRDNGGRIYTNELLQEVHDQTQKQVPLIKQSSLKESFLRALRMAKELVFNNMKPVCLAIGGLLGAFIGGLAGAAVASFFGVAAGAVLGAGLGVWAGNKVARALTPAEQEAKQFIDQVDDLWKLLQKVRLQVLGPQDKAQS